MSVGFQYDRTNMNQLTINRFNGTEVFPIASAHLFTVRDNEDLTLWFEIEAAEKGAHFNADTLVYPATPSAELGIQMAQFDSSKLVGQQFTHPGISSDDGDSCCALFYYYEHQPLRDNQVSILSQSRNIFKICWIARTQDVNFYDGSKPDAKIEITADFTLKSTF